MRGEPATSAPHPPPPHTHSLDVGEDFEHLRWFPMPDEVST